MVRFRAPLIQTPLRLPLIEIPEPKSKEFPHIAVLWESTKVSHKRVFVLLIPGKPQIEMANKMLQTIVFVLPGCQPICVNTLLCDTLGLADLGCSNRRSQIARFVIRTYTVQRSAKGRRQKAVGHSHSYSVTFGQPFSRSRSLFGGLFLVFGTFLPIPFCLPPFAAP